MMLSVAIDARAASWNVTDDDIAWMAADILATRLGDVARERWRKAQVYAWPYLFSTGMWVSGFWNGEDEREVKRWVRRYIQRERANALALARSLATANKGGEQYGE